MMVNADQLHSLVGQCRQIRPATLEMKSMAPGVVTGALGQGLVALPWSCLPETASGSGLF